MRNNAERRYEAELYRLKGELLLQSGAASSEPETVKSHMAEAEACFRQALDIARHQQAKSLELRAAMSLSASVADTGQARRSPSDAGRDLWLVHGGF